LGVERHRSRLTATFRSVLDQGLVTFCRGAAIMYSVFGNTETAAADDASEQTRKGVGA
jgi:hypothetical protein